MQKITPRLMLQWIFIFILTNITMVSGDTPGYNMFLTDSLKAEELGSVYGTISDVWGYTHPVNGTEWAIVGLHQYGTAIVDVSDPYHLEPPPPDQIIRPNYGNSYDLKMYDRFLYIANEDDGDVLIMDLNIPENPLVVGTIPVGSCEMVKAAHNLYIDGEAGTLFVITGIHGGSAADRSIYIYDIATDPVNPQHIATWNFATQYGSWPHDMYVQGNRAYIAHVNAGLLVVDFYTDYSIDTVQQHTYSWRRDDCNLSERVTHNVWVSDNSQYAFTTDEVSPLDNVNAAAILRVWDLSDLASTPYPLIQFYDVPEDAAAGIFGSSCDEIPDVTTPFNNSIHNVMLHNRYAYITYYTKGLRILDARDPENLNEWAYYDTPAEADTVLPENWGSWGVYPYLPSGHILVSDGDGLRVFNGPPSPPNNFRVTRERVGNKYHPKTSWATNTEADIDHYDVYRNLFGCGPDCGPYTKIASVNHPGNQYLDTEIEIVFRGPSTAYYYVVAVDDSSQESIPSDIDSAPTNIAQRQASPARGTDVPRQFKLYQNVPNPFNPVTTIRYDLPEECQVQLIIYAANGNKVRTLLQEVEPAGCRSINWNGQNDDGNPVAAGVYLYSLTATGIESGQPFGDYGKVVLLK